MILGTAIMEVAVVVEVPDLMQDLHQQLGQAMILQIIDPPPLERGAVKIKDEVVVQVHGVQAKTLEQAQIHGAMMLLLEIGVVKQRRLEVSLMLVLPMEVEISGVEVEGWRNLLDHKSGVTMGQATGAMLIIQTLLKVGALHKRYPTQEHHSVLLLDGARVKME